MGKSGSHKKENTYKFQPFSERVANIRIDVIHRIRHYDEKPEEQSTYFGEAFQRWTELNCTEHFGNFRKEISNQINTFAQLVHHEDTIVAALKKHLEVPNSLAMDALLDLVVQLARDLQSDFYKHFKDFFDILVNCLNVSLQNTELLESIFSCLAYLFKFLWRYLVRDIQNVFGFFSLLLDNRYKWYIRNFAAESFAFLTRKVKNHSELFDFMFGTLEEEPDKAEGIGRLMFEMIKGVRKQFHSSAEQTCLSTKSSSYQFLPWGALSDKIELIEFLLASLQKLIFPILISKVGPAQNTDVSALPWSDVVKSLSVTMTSVCRYTSRENATVIWNTVLTVLEDLHKLYKESKRSVKKILCETMSRLLQLMMILVQYKNGMIVSDPNAIAQVLLSLLKTTDFPEIKGTSILDITSALLLSCHLQLSVEYTAKLTSLVYDNKFSCLAVSNFTKSVFNLPCFEKDVLPPLLNFCHNTITMGTVKNKEVALQTITQLILCKCPLPMDASTLENYNTYFLDFTSIIKSNKKLKSNFPHFLESLLDKTDLQNLKKENNIATLWCSLVCLPHVRPLVEKDKVVVKINKLLENIECLLTGEDDHSDLKDQLLFLYFQCVYCFNLLQEDQELFQWISVDRIVKIIRTYPADVYCLRIGDIYFTSAVSVEKEDVLLTEIFNEIFPSLSENLSSSNSQLRLLSLRILTQFELPLPVIDNEVAKQIGVFKICLEAEKIPATVHEYRRKLIYLQRLDYRSVQGQIPQGNFSQVPLRYLIGTVFCKLNLLWRPVNKLIASHAEGLNRNEFWEIFEKQLLLAADKSEVMLQKPFRKFKQSYLLMKSSKIEEQDEEEAGISTLFASNFESLMTDDTNADYNCFRTQLWKCMQSFPVQCEHKTRILSPLLMKFLSNEYFPADLMIAKSQNILQADDSAASSAKENATDKDDTEADEQPKVKRKAAAKSLLAHLELFALFKNPNSVFMEPQLKQLYFDLLLHKDNNVQKIAFECLMTYNSPFLVPYRENFERLMDDKSFKNEIVLFSLNHEENIIKPEHRQDLLPVLMRILYGKMQSKTGKNTSGKNQSNFRKALVFRFLSGCTKEELQTFVELVFSPCKHLLTDNPHEKILQIKESVDLQAIFPLKRIQGVFNTISILLDKMGYLLEYFLPSLLQIIIGLLSTVVACLDQREHILPSARNTLKNLRQLGIARVIQFFEEFEKYEFSKNEIDAVFEAAVWPQLSRLPSEGVTSPTPLLKLLNLWALNRRYVSLLAKHHPDNKSMSPLPFVFSLLSSKDVSYSVTTMIIDMVECLFSQPEDGETSSNMLEINNMITIDVSSVPSESEAVLAFPFTASLVIPHVPEILSYIKRSMQSLKYKLKKNIKSPEIRILSMISTYITDRRQCSDLISLLLPFLAKGVSRSLEMEVDVLTSMLNLLKMIEDRHKFFRPLSKLFTSIKERKSRSLLCDSFMIISRGQKALEQIAELITQMNSWDKKRVEEPDYMCRLAAFKSINVLVQEMSVINLDLLIPVVHNCSYFIMNVDDMSLRDSSTNCLKVIIKQLKILDVSENFFKELVCDMLLVQTRKGLKSKSESIRHDCITILASIAENFGKHPMCEDLAAIQDKDIEADFYENMKHIQIHNRTRALRRLIRHLNNHQMKEKSLMNYFLPLSTVFILDVSYKKRSDLIDAAVDAVGAICKHLSWKLYQKQLETFLKLLPRKYDLQKILVRVIVSILDAFHFDLTGSTFKVNFAPKKSLQGSVDSKKEDENTSIKVEEDMSVAEENTTKQEVKGLDKTSAELATTIHQIITKKLLPDLHKCITRKVKSDSEHKVNKSKYAEDDEILRVPIAIAMVRLLQHLPQKTLDYNLPGILIKVCNFLKSRSIDIREVARETLVKIMVSLGARYFPYLLLEMRGLLKRGYQLHVLCFTVHTVLKSLSAVLKTGELDSCIGSLTEVFNEELFGQVSEEKEVKEIGVLEAKVSKSYDGYGLLAKYVGSSSLSVFIQPLKQILDATHKHKIARKIQEVLRKVSLGLMENSSLTVETLMIFIHGLTNEAFPLFKESERRKKKEENVIDPRLHPPSCYLLEKELPRGGEKPKASKKTNSHVIIEFGLQLLHLSLKKSRLVATDESHLKLLDPFVQTLGECLFSKHIRINTFCVRCLCWILKFPLPSLHKHIQRISNGMFLLLKNYASAGAAKGDNFELVSMCFKAVTIMIRSVKFHKIDEDQLHVLLTFCEEDIYDHHRQSTAFNLLRAILSRKLNVSQLRELIDKVENMSVTSESPHIRLQCRQVILQYLLDYPLGKKIQSHLEYYLSQLSYEIDTGRESALEMLATIFSSFPVDILTEYSGFIFVPMSMALVNDDSPRCRKLTALAMKSLLEKMDQNTRNRLFGITVNWFKDRLLRHKNLAAQVTGLFVEVEAGKFERHLSLLLPIIVNQMDPCKYKDDMSLETTQHDTDHLLFSLLTTLIKILRECFIIRDSKYSETMTLILEHIHAHLLYPHNWVRLAAAQVFGLLFGTYTVEEVSSMVTEKESSHRQKEEYLSIKTQEKIKSLVHDSIMQLQSTFLDKELSNQIVKNLVFLAKVVKNLSEKSIDEGGESSEGGEGESNQIKLSWMVYKVVREANYEAINHPKVTIRRAAVFKWIAAVSLDLGPVLMQSVLHIMLPPLQRETSDTSKGFKGSELKNLGLEVIDILKKAVNTETFTKIYSDVHKLRADRKETRKRKRAVDAVSHPDIAAKRRVKKNISKKVAKKRKISEIRPNKNVKQLKRMKKLNT